ncbi:hypothetical protein I4U23_011941 [Adineta vaga]|nr:hypothetical protein I4U23_011941 [Adineta vaga]
MSIKNNASAWIIVIILMATIAMTSTAFISFSNGNEDPDFQLRKLEELLEIRGCTCPGGCGSWPSCMHICGCLGK